MTRSYFLTNILKFIAFVISVLMFAQCNDHKYAASLREVDKALNEAPESQKNALLRAQEMEAHISETSDPHQRFSLLMESASAYQSLDLLRSFTLVLEALKISRDLKDSPSDSIRALLKLAFLSNTEGMMVKEASEIFSRLKGLEIPDTLKDNFYILGIQINQTLADRAIEPILKNKYLAEASRYRDSVLNRNPSNGIVGANKIVEKGEIRKALNFVLQNRPDTMGGERMGPYYHYIAGLYRRLGMQDSIVFYLSLAAADDLKNGIREYKALTELAEALAKIDVVRARRYIQQSETDARLSRYALHQRDVDRAFIIINGEYGFRQQQITMFIIVFAISLLIISILISFSVIGLQNKNRQLSSQRRELIESQRLLDKSNNELEKMNNILARDSRTKDYYLKSFMNLCVSYLDKMERYRARLGHIATHGDIKKIIQAINSSRYANQEISDFYNEFDQAFISMYPDYVSTLNTLLREDCRYPENSKFTTELRIYALIWIGIEASGEIAKFLRCSESTVYNYRTLMRNRAIERHTFESSFISISKEKRHN